jgi:nitrous oxidase accessory protein NosD
MRSKARLACLAAALLASSATARAEITDCIDVATLPFETNAVHIRTPGTYCLKAEATGPIRVNANDVLLDLNGHALKGGVSTDFTRENITVRNGVVRRDAPDPSLLSGVTLAGKGMRVEHIRASHIGIAREGAVIRHNTVVGGDMTGIIVNGAFAQVTDNRVFETGLGRGIAEADAIKVQNAQGAVIKRNFISNTVAATRVGYPFGILIQAQNNEKITIAGNRISGMGAGIVVSSVGSHGTASTLLIDNIVSDTITPFHSGNGVVFAGSTNYSF